MLLTWDEIQANAIAFSARWKDARREKSDAQPFVAEFLRVFGVDDPVKTGEREKTVKISGAHDKYVDFFWKSHIAIEMKSRGKDLGDAYEQLKDYMSHIPDPDVPDLWMTCDFETFQLWRRSENKRSTFALKDLRKHIHLFAAIAGHTEEPAHHGDQTEVNVKAAEKMAKLHDALKDCGYTEHSLEVYLVRLLFCLFAEDTGIFPQYSFLEYIKRAKKDGSDLSEKIARLFEILNTPTSARAKKTNLPADLQNFQYINGGLFSDILPFADFTGKMRDALIECAQFDWSGISPAIFGAMFQGVMDKEKRREIGAHYTSEENILKLINPLFMDKLRAEFESVKSSPRKLEDFHIKIASLKFLDPACGCGNFLIISYRELRKLELEVLKRILKHETLKMKMSGDVQIVSANIVLDRLRVNVEQFYGIEYEEFPCEIAKVGMWLMDHQMNLEASELFGHYYVRLPLERGATIVHGNALRMDWEGLVPREELSFILGNPPFNGARLMNDAQKSDMLFVFGTLKGAGNLDYVTAWYKKAADMMNGTEIRAAFVSTNSISQGEQVAILWKPLMGRGIFINFGVQTFKWSNEARGKAAVHCVIVGFSYHKTEPNINPYLIEASNVFIESRSRPICDVSEMVFGSMPNDGGNFLLSAEEKMRIVEKESYLAEIIRPFLGADEFINNISRYCIWLKDISPAKYQNSKEIQERICNVIKHRKNSTREATRKLADFPTLFGEIRHPETDYLLIPSTSSEHRKYIPIGFIDKNTIGSNANLLIPNATLYEFGVLTSLMHMAWVRYVCGRLEMRYRYSASIVYNNYPWPSPSSKQKNDIEAAAQGVLDARRIYPDLSLATLYDSNTMIPELVKAHRKLDKAVDAAYGRSFDDDSQRVAYLFELYQQTCGELFVAKKARVRRR